MGQRLNIEIMKGGKTLANAYYHWSAYTQSALELCKGIIKQYRKIQISPSETCDTELFQEEQSFNKVLHSTFGREAPKIERVTMKGQYTTAEYDILLAIRLLESTGAGVNEKELARIRDEGVCAGITLRTAIGRNEGLIAVTQEGIDETRNWQEGQATIDLDRERVYFGVFWISNMEEYLENYEIDPETNPELLPVKLKGDIDIEDFGFADIDKATKLVKETLDTGIESKDGTIYSWIY